MPDPQDKQTGLRMRQFRRNAGLTQAQLAEKTGIHVNTIARLERGKHTPSHPTLRKLAEVLGVTVSDILGY
jgi:transcriptional regulator with XRE-family HTH domain